MVAFMVHTNPEYRPCVGVALINSAGLVFIGRRRNKGTFDIIAPPHLWQMPQGGIDDGEDPYIAAQRELFEETNVSSTELIAEAPRWLTYDLPSEATQRWKGKYRGQTQRWFALRFTGNESEINIHHPAGGAHKPEFDEWRWEKLANLPNLIVPFKKQVYEHVVTAFADFAAR
jgi:putative (di)nucleoside polyphosphate hydrolase